MRDIPTVCETPAVSELPQWLREHGLFCVHRNKVPYNPRTGDKARPNDRETFAPLAVAVEALGRGGYDGLGVGLFDGLCCLDMDHCLTPEGMSEQARDVVCRMDSYTEVSPSGTGLHILFLATTEAFDRDRYYMKHNGLEAYVSGATARYMTFTGNRLTSAPAELRTADKPLLEVLERFMVRQQKANPEKTLGPVPVPEPKKLPISLSDDELLRRALNAKNGAAFGALFGGDTAPFNSHSEADLALCNMLAFWTGRDTAQMDRLFRASGLYRPKWDRTQSGSTYGALTIATAIRGCREVYNPDGFYKTDTCAAFGETAPESSYRPAAFTDADLSDRFAATLRDTLAYTDGLGWLGWDGRCWRKGDDTGIAAAKAFTAGLLEEASAELKKSRSRSEAEREAAKAYHKFALRSRNVSSITALLTLAKPALRRAAEDFDAGVFDLNTPAGLVDLRTGELRPHDKAAFCTKMTVASPGPEGQEEWSAFLSTISGGNPEMAGFLRQVAGMALFGRVYEETLMMAYGGGRNGKSTFFNVLGLVLGDYAGNIDVQTLMADRSGNKGAAMATLRGVRLAVTGELDEGQRLSVAVLKKLCSTDRITVEEKYKSPETVTPSHSLVLFTNHLPRVGANDSGTWRRITVVPFTATIPTGSGVQNYAQLLAERAGAAVLSWAINGAVAFAAGGFKLDRPPACWRPHRNTGGARTG